MVASNTISDCWHESYLRDHICLSCPLEEVDDTSETGQSQVDGLAHIRAHLLQRLAQDRVQGMLTGTENMYIVNMLCDSNWNGQ